MGTTRNLQDITIIGGDDGQVNDAPTRSPVVAVPRPTSIRVCAKAQTEDAVATAEVVYRYEVEMDPKRGGITDSTWSSDIPSWVDGATVDILAGHFCTESDATEQNNSNNRLLLSSLAPCVLSISSGSRDVFLDEACTVSGTLCGLYSGTVRVTYTDLCAESDVVDAAVNFVTAGSGESDLLQIANQIAQQDDVSLTSVTFSEYPVDPAPQTEEPPISNELNDGAPNSALNKGLTKAGVAMIALLGVLLIFLSALAVLRRRHLKKKKSKGKKDDDAQSLKTAGSSPCLDRDVNRPDMLQNNYTPESVNAVNEVNDCGSNGSSTLVRSGGQHGCFFGDVEGSVDPALSVSVNDSMADTNQLDAISVHSDSFKEILDDVTYVRSEQPDAEVDVKHGRPKFHSPGCSPPNSTTSVTL